MNIPINTMERGDFFLKEPISILQRAGDSYEFDAKIVHMINRGY